MFAYWAYILIGNNETGKTSFQRHLIEHLCHAPYKRLHTNQLYKIQHHRAPRSFEYLFAMNRSVQEKWGDYKSVGGFFKNHFKGANVCILSSHVSNNSPQQITEMMEHLRRRCFNVGGVFFSNGFNREAEEISTFDWDERFWVENPKLKTEEDIQDQLRRLAREFGDMLLARAQHQ